MKKTISWIIAALIFISVVGFVAFNITKAVIKSVVEERVAGPTREIIRNSEGHITEEELEKRVQEEVAKIVEARSNVIFSQILRLSFDREINNSSVTWAGHPFEISQLRTIRYQTDNDAIEWTESGWQAGSYSLPRAKLLDINMNQKIKVRVTADMEGELRNGDLNCEAASCRQTADYRFSEFATYFVDANDTKYGIALLGTRDNIVRGNARTSFNFQWFSVENTGEGVIIFEDSSGNRYVFDESTPSESGLADLNPNDEWRLRIISHVNGEGYAKLAIKKIEVMR